MAIDIHAVLKQAIKDLPADASPADVSSYIDAECQKQAAIEGAAAKEEKAAEKEEKKAEAEMADAVPPVEEVKPEDVPPAAEAMSSQLPGEPTQTDAPQGGGQASGALADSPTPEQAGLAQLEALLAESGASLASLIAAIQAKPDALKALLGGGDGAPADSGIPVSDMQMEGTRPLSANHPDAIALTAAKDTIATLSAKVTEYEAAAKKHAEDVKAAEARGAAEAAKAKELAIRERVKGLVTSARLIPTRGNTVDQTIATWTQLGLTAPDTFEAMVATLPEGVPLSAITAKDGPEFRTSAAGDDGDKDSEDGPAFRLAVKQWEPVVGRKAAEAKARETVSRLRTGGKTTTDKITGAA